jgi:hypothetical protein
LSGAQYARSLACSARTCGIESGHGDAPGIEAAQRGLKPAVIVLLAKENQINVLANLRRAVEYAGLPSHKQRLDAIALDRRKD